MRELLVALFALTYVGISARRVQLLPIGRPAMALVGAAVIVAVGQLAGPYGLTVDEALRAVEPHTIGLLLGMMILSAALAEAGFFHVAAAALTRLSTRSPRASPGVALLWWVTITCGVLSAVLVNDAVCLLATPLVVDVVRRLGLPLRPFVFAVAMGANAGSALTLSGNPQNMLVAKLSGLGYRDYLLDAAVPTLLALVATAAILHAMFRSALRAPSPAHRAENDVEAGRVPQVPPTEGRGQGAESPLPLTTAKVTVDRPLLVVTVAAVVGVIAANLFGASLALSALAGASLALIAARRRAEALLAQVDWSVLLFFSGLFVLVAALHRTAYPTQWLADIDAPHSVIGLAGVVSVGSQIVSNVPLILLIEPWIGSFPDAALAWTVTALVATLAGNLTLLGSVANIIVIERARERVGFFSYLRVGVPVTLVSTSLAIIALLWMRS